MPAPDNPDVQTLDAREIDGPPFGPISKALGALESGETLVLLNSFEPEPLYDVLSEQGFSYETDQIDGDDWCVKITRE